MPREVEFLAREICRKAGYDPDQLVVEIDGERDFDYLHIGLAPVDFKKIKPIFIKFINEARNKLREESSKERQNIAIPSS